MKFFEMNDCDIYLVFDASALWRANLNKFDIKMNAKEWMNRNRRASERERDTNREWNVIS